MEDLSQYNLTDNPIQSFQRWFEQASKSEANPAAMALATSDCEGDVQVRMMLFKGIKDERLTFYTNTSSPKAQQMATNPRVSALFWWESLGQQVRIQGKVQKMAESQAREYFLSRDKDSQIASLISNQSSEIESKAALIETFKKKQRQYADRAVDFPNDKWGGYYIIPSSFEFFVYGEHRLNDRFHYSLDGEKWKVLRLQP